MVGGSVLGWTETLKLGRPKVRKFHTVTGIGFGTDYGVHNDSYNNMRRGLMERVLFRVEHGKSCPTPQPAENFYEKELSEVRTAIVANTPVCRRLTRDEFVGCYSGRKQAVYQRASDSLRTKPLNKSDAFLSTFLKSEKLNFQAKPDPAPRVIQPRSPRYNVEVGRSLKRMEVALKEGIAEVWGGPTIMKGYNANSTGKHFADIWGSFRHPAAIPIDAVRFDQHVSVDALKYEHSVYVACVPKPDRSRLARLLREQLVNTGFARMDEGDIKYTVAGRRMSGDMNTGMGNCLLMCSLFKRYLHILGIKGRLANNGDDCTLFVEAEHVPLVNATISDFFLNAGFKLTVEPACYRLEDIEFCQTHPVEVSPGTYRMVRDPRTAIDKDLSTQIDLSSTKLLQQWAGAIGSCELALGSGIPLWQSFGQMLIANSRRGGEFEIISSSGMSRLANGMDAKVVPINDTCRVSFWRAFGITPDAQETIERHFSTCTLTHSADDVDRSPIANFAHIF